MDYQRFDSDCSRLIECYRKLDENALYLAESCVDEESVKAVEESIGAILPSQLRNFFLRYSGKVRIHVYLPDGFCHSLPRECGGIFGAIYEISLDEVEGSELGRRGWITDCFTNEEDEYDRVWYNKLGIISVGNGDIIALDTASDPENPPVVYLSHDDGEGHGVVLARDFESFLTSLISVGGCGMEDWQMLPFIPDKNTGIDPSCENAQIFRKLIGFELSE